MDFIVKHTSDFIKDFKSDVKNPILLIDCIKKAEAESIIQSFKNLQEIRIIGLCRFNPVKRAIKFKRDIDKFTKEGKSYKESVSIYKQKSKEYYKKVNSIDFNNILLTHKGNLIKIKKVDK